MIRTICGGEIALTVPARQASLLSSMFGPMGSDHQALTDLHRTVQSDPHNHGARVELIDQLIERGDIASASSHTKVLVEACPNESWALQRALRVSTEAGDHMRSAHYKRLLVTAQKHEEFSDPGRMIPHPAHPSQRGKLLKPLRLLVGGRKDPVDKILSRPQESDGPA